ncbi:MAG: hypothetical protein ACUVSK_12075, partial [Desulfotomaculales bacterium]
PLERNPEFLAEQLLRCRFLPPARGRARRTAAAGNPRPGKLDLEQLVLADRVQQRLLRFRHLNPGGQPPEIGRNQAGKICRGKRIGI